MKYNLQRQIVMLRFRVVERDPKRGKGRLGWFPFCNTQQNGARTQIVLKMSE
jgi:hypothetical protein